MAPSCTFHLLQRWLLLPEPELQDGCEANTDDESGNLPLSDRLGMFFRLVTQHCSWRLTQSDISFTNESANRDVPRTTVALIGVLGRIAVPKLAKTQGMSLEG